MEIRGRKPEMRGKRVKKWGRKLEIRGKEVKEWGKEMDKLRRTP